MTEEIPTISTDLEAFHRIRASNDLEALTKKFKRDYVIRLLQLLNIPFADDIKVVEGLRELQMHLLKENDIQVVQVVHGKEAASDPNRFEILEGEWGLRCVTCGEIAVVFAPGFDPNSPKDEAGMALPVHQWPMRFRGFPHHTEQEMFGRSRENAKCPCCEASLPFQGGEPKTRAHRKYLVRLVLDDGTRNPLYPLHEAKEVSRV